MEVPARDFEDMLNLGFGLFRAREQSVDSRRGEEVFDGAKFRPSVPGCAQPKAINVL